LRANGITMRIAKQSIGARAATAAEARVLGETKGAPVLTMKRATYDDQGRAVEHGSHIYRAARYSFDLTLTGLCPAAGSLRSRPPPPRPSGCPPPAGGPRPGRVPRPRARC